MASTSILSIVICAAITFTHAEDKWVWSSERKTENAKITVAKPIVSDNSASESESSRKIDEQILRLFDDDDYRKARYEVQEASDFANGGRPLSPTRSKPYAKPIPKYPNYPTYPDRPFPDRPSQTPLPDRYPGPLLPPSPIPRPGPDELISPIPAGNSHVPVRRQPPANGAAVGILTGPVPSWEKPILHKNGDPTNFEHCKCSFSFNCKSPGIQFGSCDQGKTYCCYNEFNSPKEIPQPNGFGSTNIERFDKVPAVLVGPGGPSRPLDHREGYRPRPFPANEGENGYIDLLDYGKRPPVYPIIPNKPILPPYIGLHNDYRSSK